MSLAHGERHRWIKEISEINRKINQGAGPAGGAPVRGAPVSAAASRPNVESGGGMRMANVPRLSGGEE